MVLDSGCFSGERFTLCASYDVMLMKFLSTVCILRFFSVGRSQFSDSCISTHAQRISVRRSRLKGPFLANGLGFLHVSSMYNIIMNPSSSRLYIFSGVSNYTHLPAARAFQTSRSAAEIVVHYMRPETPGAALVSKTLHIVDIGYPITSGCGSQVQPPEAHKGRCDGREHHTHGFVVCFKHQDTIARQATMASNLPIAIADRSSYVLRIIIVGQTSARGRAALLP